MLSIRPENKEADVYQKQRMACIYEVSLHILCGSTKKIKHVAEWMLNFFSISL